MSFSTDRHISSGEMSGSDGGAVGGQRLNRNLASIENIDGIFNVTKDYVENMWISRDSIA